jgi:hypothetical protein
MMELQHIFFDEWFGVLDRELGELGGSLAGPASKLDSPLTILSSLEHPIV